MEKQRVLFLSTRNSIRSQMAEAFLRKYAGDHFDVYSAGLEPEIIDPFTIQVMEGVRVDMSSHSSKSVNVYLGKVLFQTMITVCDDAENNCPTIWPGLVRRLHWSFQDPASFEGPEEEKLARFCQVRDQIDQKIRSWLAEQEILVV